MAGSLSIPQFFSETLAKLDLVASMGRRKSLERENGEETWCPAAAKGIRGMVVEACLFCLPHLHAGHC